MPPAGPARVHAALLTVAVLFSLNYIISKFAMQSFHPIAFAYLRILGAAIALHFVVPRDHAPLTSSDSRSLILYAVLAVVLNQTLFLTGLAFSNAHIAAILITTMPVFALAAAMFVGREQATMMKAGGIALAGAGALLVVGIEGVEGTRRSLIGAILIIGNSLCYSLYLVLSKPMMARLTAKRVIRRMFMIATIVMIPVAAVPLAKQEWTSIPISAWIGLLLVIAGPTVAAYLLNAWALAHADSSLVAAYVYVQPVLTAILAAVYLHERIRPIVGVAAAMIFMGLYISGKRDNAAAPQT